jgi:hypothetical protein
VTLFKTKSVEKIIRLVRVGEKEKKRVKGEEIRR